MLITIESRGSSSSTASNVRSSPPSKPANHTLRRRCPPATSKRNDTRLFSKEVTPSAEVAGSLKRPIGNGEITLAVCDVACAKSITDAEMSPT